MKLAITAGSTTIVVHLLFFLLISRLASSSITLVMMSSTWPSLLSSVSSSLAAQLSPRILVRLTVLSLAGAGSAWGFDVTGVSPPDCDLWVVLDGVGVLAARCPVGETFLGLDGKSLMNMCVSTRRNEPRSWPRCTSRASRELGPTS